MTLTSGRELILIKRIFKKYLIHLLATDPQVRKILRWIVLTNITPNKKNETKR